MPETQEGTLDQLPPQQENGTVNGELNLENSFSLVIDYLQDELQDWVEDSKSLATLDDETLMHIIKHRNVIKFLLEEFNNVRESENETALVQAILARGIPDAQA